MEANLSKFSEQATKLCRNPVEWEKLQGFEVADDGVVSLLNKEWIRTYSEVCVDVSDLDLFEAAVLRYFPIDEVDISALENIRDRIGRARDNYLDGIGRLGALQFIPPSEHGKHYSISRPRMSKKRISYFYSDYSVENLSRLFWFWFSGMMALDEVSGSLDDFPEFMFDAKILWDRFCSGESFRIALCACKPIGELNGVTLDHICIDIGLASGSVAHAYPITKCEAEKFMNPLHVISINVDGIFHKY